MKTQNQIPVKAYKAEGFVKKYQQIVRQTVIPYQYSVLWDKADGAEKSHVAAIGDYYNDWDMNKHCTFKTIDEALEYFIPYFKKHEADLQLSC